MILVMTIATASNAILGTISKKVVRTEVHGPVSLPL
jgi:hypothetical protein